MEIEKMITKKEDLMNTYIRNDNGELLELYIASCLEFGFHLSPAFNGSELLDDEFMFIATGIDGDSVWAVNNRYDAMTSQITISDLKPRTKTEFVKVGCEWNAWEYLKAFSELPDDAQWFIKVSDDQYSPISEWFNVAETIRAHNLIYRKVETEIDERQEFIDKAMEIAKREGSESDRVWVGMIFDELVG